MKRLHLMELEDQAWFPRAARDGATAVLGAALRLTGHASGLASLVDRALSRSGRREVLDLCSGDGGPILAVVDHLPGVRATLTDLYPNLRAFRAAAARRRGRIAFGEEPRDATRVPADLPGLRTLFSGLHHFRPEDARRVLAGAVEAGHPILAVELAGRHPAGFMGAFLIALASFALVPQFRPLRWDWLFYTWIVPLIPLVILVDGTVSCFRVYGPEELGRLVEGLPADWEVGTVYVGRLVRSPALYLLGIPHAPAPRE